MRIALFATCLADAVYPDVGRATVTLLERLGHEVVFPSAQTCCGQMHVNTGYQREAMPLMRHHVDTFEPYDAIVAPSGSCVGSVRHQHAMVARGAGETGLAERAAVVASRTHELSELLIDVLGIEDVGAYFPHRVTYHPTCHSLRMLRVPGRCTWPRSWRVSNEHVPGHSRSTWGRAPARQRSRSPTPPAARWPTPSCAATSATPPRRSAASARRPSRSATTGKSCASPARRSRHPRWHGSTSTSSGSNARSPPTGGRCTGPATPTRPTRSSPGGGDLPSHILVPAIHRNRAEICEIFLHEMPGVDPSLTSEPRHLAMAARAFLRERFLRAKVAISGANFAVADTGTLLVVESEGNGRMCLTLPDTLITVMGIEKVVPTWGDLEVFL